MNENIFILDDEPDIAELVILHLDKNGYRTKGFQRPGEFFERLLKELPALLILDLMLPGTDGIEICKRMKSDERYKAIPIIMLTAKREETDKVLGLDIGADDYITKPFSPKELVARVKAVLRRGREQTREVIVVDNLMKIDLQKYEVHDRENNKIELTNTEFKILSELAKRRGYVLTREALLNAVWGKEAFVIDRNIDVHIRHLREKLKTAGNVIVNVRGVGYKLEE